jgi:nitrous-oxide reductase
VRYKSGTDARTDKRHPNATRAGRETTERTCDANGQCTVRVQGTLIRSHITPEIVEAEVGDEIYFHMTNLERAQDQTHGFAMYGHSVQLSVEPGKTATAYVKADREGVFPYYCTEFCSALHLEMQGYLLIRPKGYKATAVAMQEGQAYTKADYDTQVKTNLETQAVIDSVVAFITSRNYQEFPTAASLVEDATDQLEFAKDAKSKAESAAGKQDWQNAMLWANQWWQYQVKAADLGLRAKTHLEENNAKVIK